MKAGILSFTLVLVWTMGLAAPGLVSADVNDVLDGMTPQIKEVLRLNDKTGPFLQAETAAVEGELSSAVLGNLTLAELLPYRDRLNVASQKDAFVQEMATLSFKMPGVAQIKMRDFGSGAVFLSLHISMLLGQTLGAFLLLPEDIREMDFINTPYQDIVETIGSHNAGDFVPALQLILACAFVDLGIRGWASADAVKEARKRIEGGVITFEPKIGLGFLGFGINY